MIAWTRKAVSVAEPSVCAQPVSPRHLAEEEVLDRRRRAPSAPRASRAGRGRRLRSACARFGICRPFTRGSPGSARARTRARRRAGPGSCSAYFLISRVLARALDLVDAVGAAEDRWPSMIEYVVAVERAHRRAGGAVALGVVLAAVARAAEAGRLRRRELSRTSFPCLSLTVLLVFVVDRAVRLHGAAEVRAAVREDREARQLAERSRCCGCRRCAARPRPRRDPRRRS